MASSHAEIEISGHPQLERAGRIYIGYSGGLDSTALLYLAHCQLPREKLSAIHINHGLNPQCDLWQDHCAHRCDCLAIPLLSRNIVVNAKGHGVEKAARDARYGIFREILDEGDVLLIAHHLDDQIETVLYRLLRGSGPVGIAGMPTSRPLGKGVLFRPLLGYSRLQLEKYAVAQGLTWIDDDSNIELRFDRNYIRHKVLPVVEHRWPDYRQRIARSAEQCRKAVDVLADSAAADMEAVDLSEERIGSSIDLNEFSRLSASRQNNLLRYWIEREDLPTAPHGIHRQVSESVIDAREDAAPLLSWAGGEFRRFQGRLFLMATLDARPPDHCQIHDFTRPVELASGMVLDFVPDTGKGCLRLKNSDKVDIRFRQGGERCKPFDRARSAPLKKLFQEYMLEPWLRPLAPLIYINDQLAAVGDLFVCDGFHCAAGEAGFRIHWK